MKTIHINTSIPLKNGHTHKWRGAVIAQVLKHKNVFDSAQIPTHLFHNHDESKWNDPEFKGDYDKRSQYPLVQYQQVDGKACLKGIGAGAKAVQLWQALADQKVVINGQKQELEIRQVDLHNYQFSFTKEWHTYTLKQWIPFNPKKIEKWKQAQALIEKAQLLDNALWGHFLHAAEEWGLSIDKSRLKIHVKNCLKQHTVSCFHHNKKAFDVEIVTNCILPQGFGLGQGAAIGFGQIYRKV